MVTTSSHWGRGSLLGNPDWPDLCGGGSIPEGWGQSPGGSSGVRARPLTEEGQRAGCWLPLLWSQSPPATVTHGLCLGETLSLLVPAASRRCSPVAPAGQCRGPGFPPQSSSFPSPPQLLPSGSAALEFTVALPICLPA